MDSDFTSKLQNVLSNPEAMAKITSIASSLGGNTQPPVPEPTSPPEPSDSAPEPISSLPSFTSAMPSHSDPRLALLASIKPLLREEKRSRVDSLLNAMSIASVIKTFKK